MTEKSSWISRLVGSIPSLGSTGPATTSKQDMADCNEVHANASDFLDGECDDGLATRIRHHLGLCTQCNGWMRTLAATVGLVKDVPQQDVPESVINQVRNMTRD